MQLKGFLYLVLLCLSVATTSSAANVATEIKVGQHVTIEFADIEQGKTILTTKDEYVRAMSPFDRSARTHISSTTRKVSEAEYLEFVGKNVRQWADSDIERVTRTINKLTTKLKSYIPLLPEKIVLIHTTGKEEAGAAYTRQNAIILPDTLLKSENMGSLEALICHELFHVISRDKPELRKELYKIIGFSKCQPPELPARLKNQLITNPDAPQMNYCIKIAYQNKSLWGIPILFSRSPIYDELLGEEFFDYMIFQLLLVELDLSTTPPTAKCEESGARTKPPEAVKGYLEKIGKNTGYIIHPEEILADNFRLLICKNVAVKSPKLLRQIRITMLKYIDNMKRKKSVSR